MKRTKDIASPRASLRESEKRPRFDDMSTSAVKETMINDPIYIPLYSYWLSFSEGTATYGRVDETMLYQNVYDDLLAFHNFYKVHSLPKPTLPYKELANLVKEEHLDEPLVCARMREQMLQLIATVATSLESTIPAPSTFAQPKHFTVIQQNPTLAFRNGRPPSTRAPCIELSNQAFADYSASFSGAPPSLPIQPGSNGHNIYRCADDLCKKMPEFLNHSERVLTVRENLLKIFPEVKENGYKYSWQTEFSIENQSKIDLIYLQEGPRFKRPLIIVEVKTEVGSSGDPFFQSCATYRLMTMNNHELTRTGAPCFVIGVTGTLMTVSGAFRDSPNATPILQQFGGAVNLLDDQIGRNISETFRTLEALHRCVNMLWGDLKQRPICEPDVPSIPDFVTLEAIGPNHDLFYSETWKDRIGSPVTARILYQKFGLHQYAKAIHDHLARHNYAPALHLAGPLGSVADIYVSDYLVPHNSTEDGIGWLSLHQFGKAYPAELSTWKPNMVKAIKSLITCLQQGLYVHGRMNAHNVIVQIDSHGTPMREGATKLPILSVTDFDWAGAGGTDEGLIEWLRLWKAN